MLVDVMGATTELLLTFAGGDIPLIENILRLIAGKCCVCLEVELFVI